MWIAPPWMSHSFYALAIDTEKIGGNNGHKMTIATDWWQTEAQTDYCHQTHTCLLSRLFFDDNGHSPMVYGCNLHPRPFPSTFSQIAYKKLETGKAWEDIWNLPIALYLDFFFFLDFRTYVIFNNDYTPVTNHLSSRENSNTCIAIACFTIWAQIHTFTRIRQSTQLWIKTS